MLKMFKRVVGIFMVISLMTSFLSAIRTSAVVTANTTGKVIEDFESYSSISDYAFYLADFSRVFPNTTDANVSLINSSNNKYIKLQPTSANLNDAFVGGCPFTASDKIVMDFDFKYSSGVSTFKFGLIISGYGYKEYLSIDGTGVKLLDSYLISDDNSRVYINDTSDSLWHNAKLIVDLGTINNTTLVLDGKVYTGDAGNAEWSTIIGYNFGMTKTTSTNSNFCCIDNIKMYNFSSIASNIISDINALPSVESITIEDRYDFYKIVKDLNVAQELGISESLITNIYKFREIALLMGRLVYENPGAYSDFTQVNDYFSGSSTSLPDGWNIANPNDFVIGNGFLSGTNTSSDKFIYKNLSNSMLGKRLVVELDLQYSTLYQTWMGLSSSVSSGNPSMLFMLSSGRLLIRNSLNVAPGDFTPTLVPNTKYLVQLAIDSSKRTAEPYVNGNRTTGTGYPVSYNPSVATFDQARLSINSGMKIYSFRIYDPKEEAVKLIAQLPDLDSEIKDIDIAKLEKAKNAYNLAKNMGYTDYDIFNSFKLIQQDTVIVKTYSDAGYSDYMPDSIYNYNGHFLNSISLYGYDNMLVKYGDSKGTAQWATTITSPGQYEAYYWNSTHETNCESVTIEVNHKYGTASTTIDHKNGPNGWVYLGTFDYDASATSTIKMLSKKSGGFIRASAVCLRKVNKEMNITDAYYTDNGNEISRFDNVTKPGLKFTINSVNTLPSCVAILAVYKGEDLIGIKTEPIPTFTGGISYTVDLQLDNTLPNTGTTGYSAKGYIWDGLNTVKPIIGDIWGIETTN